MYPRKPELGDVDWPEFRPGTRNHVEFSYPPKTGSWLAPEDKLDLFAHWYDLFMKNSPGAHAAPQLKKLLSLSTPK
jgi:hypothetical protein